MKEKAWRLVYAPKESNGVLIKIVLWVREEVLQSAIEFSDKFLPPGFVLEAAERRDYVE